MDGMLTVSEENGAINHGVTLNFFLDDGKLKFEANPEAISEAKLKASSELLKLALIVKKN
jgi:hypothetical protein